MVSQLSPPTNIFLHDATGARQRGGGDGEGFIISNLIRSIDILQATRQNYATGYTGAARTRVQRDAYPSSGMSPGRTLSEPCWLPPSKRGGGPPWLWP